MIKVAGLYVKKQKGFPPDEVGKLRLVKDCGVFGDVFAKGGDRQVCLMFSETKKQLDLMDKGLVCLSRFSCNILLDGADVSEIATGELLGIGDARLEISIVGRECHSLCSLDSCPLIEGAVFAKVISGGEIAVGDEAKYV